MLLNQGYLFLSCFALYFASTPTSIEVLIVLVSLILSGLIYYVEKPIFTLAAFLLYGFLSFTNSSYLYFSPLFCYQLFLGPYKWVLILLLLPMRTHLGQPTVINTTLILVVAGFALLLKKHTLRIELLTKEHQNYRDTSEEIAILLKQKNAALHDKQDYEVNLATVNERNRIAREIHDNVGHLLSRCLLQIGALIAINKEPALSNILTEIKATLSEAMTTIRNSVHNLHDEAVDLKLQLEGLAEDFKFCPITLDYGLEDQLPREIKYCFIAITKEALSNIIKHSNATKVQIVLRQHPALYQLIIQDNGTTAQQTFSKKKSLNENLSQLEGIGLSNMIERIEHLHGNFSIDTCEGFKVFISIPK